jgi:hypothetical protein
MDQSRTQKLQQLLKRLSQAVHSSVVRSDEVQACLQELRQDGWDAVMLLEASLVCRNEGAVDTDSASLHVHIDPGSDKVRYRIDARDAAFLNSVGISPSRHRATPSIPRVRSDDQSDR